MLMALDRLDDTEDLKKYARVVAKAWMDPDFKEVLLSDAERVLTESGFDFPAGIQVRVVDSSETTIEVIDGAICFGLPPAPKGGLGDESLTWSVRDAKGCFPGCAGGGHTTNTTASGPAQCTGPFCGIAG